MDKQTFKIRFFKVDDATEKTVTITDVDKFISKLEFAGYCVLDLQPIKGGVK
jgi:hypothetical protein